MDFFRYFGWNVFPKSYVFQTVVFDWGQKIIIHSFSHEVMPDCGELPFLELSVISLSDSEQCLGDWHNL